MTNGFSFVDIASGPPKRYRASLKRLTAKEKAAQMMKRARRCFTMIDMM